MTENRPMIDIKNESHRKLVQLTNDLASAKAKGADVAKRTGKDVVIMPEQHQSIAGIADIIAGDLKLIDLFEAGNEQKK